MLDEYKAKVKQDDVLPESVTRRHKDLGMRTYFAERSRSANVRNSEEPNAVSSHLGLSKNRLSSAGSSEPSEDPVRRLFGHHHCLARDNQRLLQGKLA